MIWKALWTIPVDEFIVVAMSCMETMTMKTVAKACGQPLSWALSKQHQGLRRLSNKLKKEGL